MDSSKIIDRLGGTSEVAKLCECSPQAVSQWFGPDPDPSKSGAMRSIPKARLMYLRAVKPDVFAAIDAEEAAEASRALAGRKGRGRATASLAGAR